MAVACQVFGAGYWSLHDSFSIFRIVLIYFAFTSRVSCTALSENWNSCYFSISVTCMPWTSLPCFLLSMSLAQRSLMNPVTWPSQLAGLLPTRPWMLGRWAEESALNRRNSVWHDLVFLCSITNYPEDSVGQETTAFCSGWYYSQGFSFLRRAVL